MRKLKAVGWIAYCTKLERGTAVHLGPWKGWLEPTKKRVEDAIEKSKSDVAYATLVPAKVFVEVPPKPLPPKRCGKCRRVL